eukprot:GFUD01034157.1.p1 GENE.GFUD01034157.1~~GFUD01034157.1.p1  ORF type:complete len:1343 (+),score=442.59 GFUD01034157.1:145-4173(+)
MSLKVCIDKVGRQSVTVEKERKKSKGGRRSRAPVDLRAVLSSKERSGREEQRESRDRERADTGDLRDRLEKNRVQIDFEDFDPVMKGENCDISELGKQKLLSMFLDGNNPVKELKGKENEKSDDPSEIVKKAKKELEKTLSSEWGQRKKKKKKRSHSRSDKDRKPLVDRETENRKRKHTPEKESKDVSKIKKEKVRSPSRVKDDKKKKKEKKNRKRTASRETKDRKRSPSKENKEKKRSVSREKKRSPSRTVSGRKSRIDSGISTGTNFSKYSVSISPRDERVLSPKKEPLVVNNKTSSRKDRTKSPRKERTSPRRDRTSPRRSSPRKDKVSPRKDRNSPRRDKKSPRKDRTSPGRDKSDTKDKKSPKKEGKSEGRKTSNSPSPSPPRRVLERSVDDERDVKKEDKVADSKEKVKEKEKNPYSVYEEKHGKKHDPRRRSREREPRRRRSKERDLKDEIDEMKRERMRARSRSRERRRLSDYDRYGRRPFRSGRYSPRGSRVPSPSSWEDKVESFLQNTSTSSTLVEIIPSGLLPQEFDPSKPPPNLAVVPPDYALTEYSDPILTPSAPNQPIRLLTDVQTGQLIPQPGAPTAPETSYPPTYQPPPTLPPPDYEQTVDITIAKEPQAIEQHEQKQPLDEFAAMNALNQENEKNRKENKPLTLKEKKKLEKSRKEIWQFVAKKLIGDPVFCNKIKKKKTKGIDDLKEKAEKCAVRLGLKLEKSGFSETRLWLMLKDNEKGILGFYDELSAAVINGTIETDVEARRPKDRLDSELLKDGTVFKYIGQYIQGNPTQGRSRSESDLLTTGDLQSILELVNTNTGETPAGTDTEQNTPEPEPADPQAKREGESEWDYSLRSFSPFKTYLDTQSVPPEVVDAYTHTLVLSGFNYTILGQCVTNFQPPEPENPGEPPETVYGHLLGCLREISFEKYPKLLTDNLDGHTVSIVRFVLDHFSKPKSPSPSPSPPRDTQKSSPVPPSEETVPTGGNTTNQLPRKKYVTVSVSVDTIPVEGRLAVWQICLHTPGLPDEQDPDFEMMMVPGGVGEARLQEAGFMFNQEKGVWYHQGTEFGRRKAENEEKSVEKLVNYLEELRGGGRGAGLNNGLVLLFECAEDFGLVRSLLSGHSADIWSDTVRGVGCIDQYTRQADIPATYCPPYYKFCVGGEGKWLTTLNITSGGVQRQVKIEAETRAEMVYNILCDLFGSAPTYETFTKWYCYPSQSDTVATMAGNLELQRQLLPLQTHVDRQLFNARVQCVLEGVFAPRSELEQTRPCACVARQSVRRLVSLGFNMDNLKNSFRADPNYEIPANVFLQDMTQVQRLRVHAQTDFVRKFIKEYFSPHYFNKF